MVSLWPLLCQHNAWVGTANPRGRRFGEEIKRMDARSLTGSMRIALTNLQLQHLTGVYLGKQSL
jgi:hypothetical protein